MNSSAVAGQPNPELVQAILETLSQGERLLEELTDDAYTHKLPVAFNASIGGHYRHCLDHFRTLLDAWCAGDLNYDHRERGTAVETDRYAALAATRALRDEFERVDPHALSRPLMVTCKTSYAASESQTSPSTVGREAMYAVAHAVHHYALIGVMAGVMGIALPAGIGVAPSTLKHQAAVAAAA
jgi:thiamine pyrophosphate-dependent acetolactate synthase large subunit-like protein